MNFVRKHPKFMAAVVAILAVIGIFAYRERLAVAERRMEQDFPNNPVDGGAKTDTFYSDQLTERERAAYGLMITRLENLEGGVVELEEPLTGREYVRVVSAIENERNLFYAFFEIPMSADNVYLKYKNSDITSVKTAEIKKTILFLSCAEGINVAGSYGEDGTVENLSQVNEGLSKNDPERLAELLQRQQEMEEKISGILEGIPEGAGEWDTLTYFLGWMDENLMPYTGLGTDAFSFTTMDEVFSQAYESSNASCVLGEGKATMPGYTKLLSLLLNRAGIPSHIVLGTWGWQREEGYIMCVAELSGESVYVDASGAKTAKLGDMRCLTETEALNHMEPAAYFNYD